MIYLFVLIYNFTFTKIVANYCNIDIDISNWYKVAFFWVWCNAIVTKQCNLTLKWVHLPMTQTCNCRTFVQTDCNVAWVNTDRQTDSRTDSGDIWPTRTSVPYDRKWHIWAHGAKMGSIPSRNRLYALWMLILISCGQYLDRTIIWTTPLHRWAKESIIKC